MWGGRGKKRGWSGGEGGGLGVGGVGYGSGEAFVINRHD